MNILICVGRFSSWLGVFAVVMLFNPSTHHRESLKALRCRLHSTPGPRGWDTIIIIISSLPKGRSLASKFSNCLGFQPSSLYPHVSHLIHRRSCPFLAFPLVSFLPFSLLAPISSDHLPLQHVQSRSSFCPISFSLSFSFCSWS